MLGEAWNIQTSTSSFFQSQVFENQHPVFNWNAAIGLYTGILYTEKRICIVSSIIFHTLGVASMFNTF